MLLLNIDYVPGKEIEALGLVKGTTVHSKNFGKDFMASMKTLVGGDGLYRDAHRSPADRHQAHGGRGRGHGCRRGDLRPLRQRLRDGQRRRGGCLRHGGKVQIKAKKASQKEAFFFDIRLKSATILLR